MQKIALNTYLFFAGALIAGGLYFRSPSAFLLAAVCLLSLFALTRLANHFYTHSWIRWSHSLLFETVAVFLSAFLRPFGSFPRSDSRRFSGQGKPILLIHGYLHNRSAWAYLRRQLERLKLGPVYCLNLGFPFHSIRTYAEKIQQKAEAIEQETNRKDLTIIGHSMGGLVGCWYATHLAPEGKVSEVVTIGSPLKGTYVAAIALGLNGKEMRYNSPLVQELQEKMKQCTTTRFYHIATRTDQLVIPYTSAVTEAGESFIMEDIGHMTLLYSPRVVAQIAQWLVKE